MRLNDCKRKKLKGSMVRVQDVALVLHNNVKREMTENKQSSPESGVLEAKVLAMYSDVCPPGENTVHGIISAALRLSESELSFMIQLPINIPLWFFNSMIPSLLRLSRKLTPP
jgi:hypothetical protein